MRNLVWMASIAGALCCWLPGCGDSTGCKNPCNETAGCPSVGGDYQMGVQTQEAGCTTIPMSLTLQVIANESKESTQLRAFLTVGGNPMSMSMEGELCDSSSTDHPKLYGFAAGASSSSGDLPTRDFISGQFVLLQGGEIHVCATFMHSEGTGNETCRDAMILYSSQSLCK